MTRGKVNGQIIEPTPIPSALSEFDDNAQGQGVAAHAGQVFTKQVEGAAEVPGGRRADHFDVMAFPGHLASADGNRTCVGESAEVGYGEAEARVCLDGVPERRHRVRRRRRLLRVAIEGGGLDVCRDRPTVVLHRRTGTDRSVLGRGLRWLFMHGCMVRLWAEAALRWR
jgi:hypothetical protein